jgi:hypothetical protein
MKHVFRNAYLVLGLLSISIMAFAQQPELQNFRLPGMKGLNVFETPKDDVPFDGVKIRVGGDFAIQMQGISQTNGYAGSTDSLEMTLQVPELGTNINLPTANFNIDAQFADGVRMHLRTYLSARHHNEAWVKGGHIQVDNLDFIKDGFLSGFMNMARFRFGMDDINYGDAHFRRSDNARAIYNPFVGNYIMDAFTTEPFAELTIMKSGIIGVLGMTNGRLNQNPFPGDNGATFYGKLGYDNQINDDLRVRLTGSFYSSSANSTRDYLYGGDRAGARYYGILGGSDFDPRINPRWGSQNAFQINPFVKFQNLEFFGIYEMASNKAVDADGNDIGGALTQMGAEVLYRFANDHLYVGGRYNSVSGKFSETASEVNINRMNLGCGWFMTENILTKVEYVSTTNSGDGFMGTPNYGGEWNGLMIEAVIGF